MIQGPRTACVTVLSWIALVLPALATGPELAGVMERMRVEQSAFDEWSARMKVDIDLPGMRVKGKKLNIFFTSPDSFRFEAKGFALLPRRTMMWTADSLFKGLSEVRIDLPDDSLTDSPLRVRGLFREGGLFARMSYRVDTTRWLVTHINTSVITQSDTLEALALRNRYLEVAAGHWLPAAVDVEMRLGEDLQQFYEKLRAPLRRRKKARDGTGTITMQLDRHEWRLGEAGVQP